MPEVTEISRSNNPFPVTGVSRDNYGAPYYDRLPATLLDMLAEQVDNRPNGEAVVELGGDRLTYRQLWERASRVAGGLHADGLSPGDRVAIGQPVMTLEAMKMEHVHVAGIAGTVSAIDVAEGEQVTTGRIVVEIDASAA